MRPITPCKVSQEQALGNCRPVQEAPGVYPQDALETSLCAHNMLPAC